MKVPFSRCEDGCGIYFTAPGLKAPHRFGTRASGPSPDEVSARQIHSDIVLYVDGAGNYTADGLFTDKAGLALAVRTADCVPVLMYDEKAKAAAAVHAGWRGTAAGIVLRALEKMFSVGASPESLAVAVGPCVCFDCYEVQEDFRNIVRKGLGTVISEKFIREKNGELHADVAGMNAELLRNAGIPDANIAESGLCTCCLPDLFFSYRRDGAQGKCQTSVIRVPHKRNS